MSERVSFGWPQVVPARAFMMLRRLENLVVMFLIWRPKVKRGSKVIPKILGFLSSGIMLLLMDTWGES